jgi:uncharacterized protein YbcI
MDASGADARGRVLSTISNGMVRIHREAYGRGADRVRTIMDGNYVVSFLDGIFTPAERTLISAGEADAVSETRLAFQRAMRAEFVRVVEEATGRKVIAFLSQTHIDPDLAVETFVLEGRDGAGADPA